MALIKCPKCGGQISDRVIKCPHCDFDFVEYNQELERRKQETEQKRKLEEKKRQEDEERIRKELESKEKCPECGAIVDRGIKVCPICGFPIREDREHLEAERLKKKKMYAKIGIIAGVLAIVIIMSVVAVSKGKKDSQYNKAVKWLEQGSLNEAEGLLKELKGYKDSEELLEAIEIGYKIDEIKSVEDDFIHTDLFDPYEIDSVIKASEKYESLKYIREAFVNYLYNIAEDYIEMGLDEEYYDFAQYLIDTISPYKDTKKLTVKKQNAQIFDIVKDKIEAKKYDEIIQELDKVEEKDEKVQKLNDSYKKLYEAYGSFLGDWGSSTEKGGLEFSIAYDFAGYKKSDECYFEVRWNRLLLDDEDALQEKTGRGYTQLKVEGDILSLMFNTYGLLEPEYKKAECRAENGTVKVTVDGKEIDTAPAKASDNKERKKAPKIGDSAADVRLSSWGNPDKINKTTTADGTSEQWVYGSQYIYLENGVVTAIQE